MSKLRENTISNCEKTFLTQSLTNHKRLDGRSNLEYRTLLVDFNKDWGSCFVKLGNTCVTAQVSCEIQEPKSSRPSEGILNINVELTALSAPNVELGRQSDQAILLNRMLEKCIKDSKAIDLESLCIKVGEKVWALRIDVNILNQDGVLADCASAAAIAALAHFRRPDVSSDGEEIIIHSHSERDPIPTVINHYPICTSFTVITKISDKEEIIVADPTLLEEAVADCSLIVGMNEYKELCGLHLGGSSYMSQGTILECTKISANRVAQIVREIKSDISKDSEARTRKQYLYFSGAKDSEESNNSGNIEICIGKIDVVEISD